MHYGFNFPWMFAPENGKPPTPVDRRALDFMAAQGFNYARFPLHYHFWSKPGVYALPDDQTAALIDGYVNESVARGIHAVINLHQAPGYSVSTARHATEIHNLWRDPEPQAAFIKYWEYFADRYRHLPANAVSFNLVNEPPAQGDREFTYVRHEALVRRTAAAIWAIDADRPIIVDGTHYGTAASTGLADLNVSQGVRGYLPIAVSHYGAPWEPSFASLPKPVWPGLVADGRVWDRRALRSLYEPWLKLEAMGVRVHVTEFGCFNVTPNDVAIRWLADLVGLWREFGWGWALWEFEGAFGIVEHGRPGACYEPLNGFNVDRELLELIRPPKI
jgi:hypothetical protein